MGNKLFRAVPPAAAARAPIRHAELPQHSKTPAVAQEAARASPEPAGAAAMQSGEFTQIIENCDLPMK